MEKTPNLLPPLPDSPVHSPHGTYEPLRGEFHEALSRKVLEFAGLEMPAYLPVPTPSPRPHGIRQKLAARKAVKLGNALRSARETLETEEMLRAGITNGMRSGRIRGEHVTKREVGSKKLAAEGRYKSGQLDRFEYEEAIHAAGHESNEHASHLRKFTDEEKYVGAQPGANELEMQERFRKLIDKTHKLGRRGYRLGTRRRMERYHRNVLGEASSTEKADNYLRGLIDWNDRLDITNLADFREQLEEMADPDLVILEQEAEAEGKEFDEEAAMKQLKIRLIPEELPDYLGITPEEFHHFVSPWRQKQLNGMLSDILVNKSWEEIDELEDRKDAVLQQRRDRRQHIENSGVPY